MYISLYFLFHGRTHVIANSEGNGEERTLLCKSRHQNGGWGAYNNGSGIVRAVNFIHLIRSRNSWSFGLCLTRINNTVHNLLLEHSCLTPGQGWEWLNSLVPRAAIYLNELPLSFQVSAGSWKPWTSRVLKSVREVLLIHWWELEWGEVGAYH